MAFPSQDADQSVAADSAAGSVDLHFILNVPEGLEKE
jgi:hypothetical protein